MVLCMDVDIEAIPEVSAAQAHAVVSDLAEGGTYYVSDLYTRYEAQCRSAGRSPVTKAALGRMLRHIGCDARKKGTGPGVRSAWRVSSTAKDARWASGEWN